MKNTRVRIWTVGLLLLLVNLLVLACGLGSAPAGTTPTRSAGGATPSSSRSVKPTASPQMENSTDLPAPSQTATIMDLSAAGLPPSFPLYPGGYNYSGIPGMMLEYTADADVRTASNFYAAQMGAGGYSDLTGGGGMTGECGGDDCGSVPTHTPGQHQRQHLKDGWGALFRHG